MLSRHGHAGVIHAHHRMVHTGHGIRCLGSGWLTVRTEGRIDQVRSGFRRIRASAGGVIVDEEQVAPTMARMGMPSAPEAIEGAVRTEIFDDANCQKQEGINLVLSSFVVVVQKPASSSYCRAARFQHHSKGARNNPINRNKAGQK